MYLGTLVPEDDFGKMTIYEVFIGCTGVPWYLSMIWENDHVLGIYRMYWGTLVPDDDFGKMTIY